jgi:phosphoribosylformylglycinamidine synthase
MMIGIIVFPGTNREQDMAHALHQASEATGTRVRPVFIWHEDTQLPAVDGVILPGGFSYGDYLRSGAMAARSPIMADLIQKAKDGLPVLGVCNGFQILCETGLLDGVLMRNSQRKFLCKRVHIRVEQTNTVFTSGYEKGAVLDIPVAHGDGNFVATPDVLARLEGEGQVLFRYCAPQGDVGSVYNLNGSMNNIAGIRNAQGNVVGMMPHPENHVDALQATQDGLGVFKGFVGSMA